MEKWSHSPTPPALPGYDIIECLGTGGTSTVWLARQQSLDRVVAVKILSPDLLADPEARVRFQTEARAAARISHPSIVSILDFGEHDGILYYVMEYVAGTSLADWLTKHQRMAHAQVLKLAEIVATALDAVFREASLIHCDIKPGNILLGTDGAVKLTDLGLARIAGAAARETSTCIEGTPTYISPEQIEGLEPDCRTDIYSLGLTLYHLLTGTPPFEGRTLEEILEAQQNDYLPDPSSLLPKLPLAYGWLLAKMTAKSPHKRPSSWGDVIRDIQRIRDGKSPLPPYPADDESTILLQAHNRPKARANTINLTAAAKKQVIISSPSPGSGPTRHPYPSAAKAASSGSGGFFRVLLFLLLLGGVGYAVYHFGLRDNPQFQALLRGESAPLPPGAPVVNARSARPAQDTANDHADEASNGTVDSADPIAPLTPTLTLKDDTGTTTPGAWDHPDFIAAAKLFNAALESWQTQQKSPDPASPALLGIISDAQKAAALFERIRPDAPLSVPVTRYANQCYQLVNDARRARLDLAARKKLFAAAPKHHNTLLSPWPTPEPPPDAIFTARHMQFGYSWDIIPAPLDRPENTDFIFLMSSLGLAPRADTRSQNDVFLHGPLRWMTPLAQAAKALGSAPGPRVPVEGTPFPYGGVFMHEIPAGKYGTIAPGKPPFPVMRLLTDSEDRLIGVQLLDEHPAPPLENPPLTFTGISTVMDFITGRTLPMQGDVRVVHRILRGDRTLRIDTEAASFADGGDALPVFRSILLIPEALAQNLLYHILGSPD